MYKSTVLRLLHIGGKLVEDLDVSMYTILLTDALGRLRDAETDFSSAQTELKYCDDRTQDILHDLELNEHTYHERGKLTTELVDIRKRRRVAKDTIEILTPLHEWANIQSVALHKLESVLGEMRKIDTRRENRMYWPKTQ